MTKEEQEVFFSQRWWEREVILCSVCTRNARVLWRGMLSIFAEKPRLSDLDDLFPTLCCSDSSTFLFSLVSLYEFVTLECVVQSPAHHTVKLHYIIYNTSSKCLLNAMMLADHASQVVLDRSRCVKQRRWAPTTDAHVPASSLRYVCYVLYLTLENRERKRERQR